MQQFKEMLITWNQTRGEREKLQHAYVVVAVIGLVIAGLVGLLNDNLSGMIVQVCIFALGVFLANVVVWALLYSLVIARLPKRTNGNGRK
jgi:predicted lysophospholipase L1 biosynthesis ABC-type transport system permease subunit